MNAHRELFFWSGQCCRRQTAACQGFYRLTRRLRTGQLGRGLIHLKDMFLEPKFLERNRRAIKGVGLDDVGTASR